MSEAKKSKQVQKSGDSSVNIQAEQITFGLSYDEARAMAQDVFDANFYKLAGIARETAKDRADEILNQLLTKLKEKNPMGLNMAQDPDFQYSLFNVQKEYARTGNKELGDILVDILVDRTKEVNRSLKRIVLNESLQTAPKLTSNQYAALSVLLILIHTIYLRMVNFSEFSKYLERELSPFVPELVKGETCYRHLVYAGCGTFEAGSATIEGIFLKNYPLLFVKPFPKEEVADLLNQEPNLSTIISPSPKDDNLVELLFTGEEIIRKKALQLSIEASTIDNLLGIMKRHTMDSKEAKEYSIKAHPCMTILYDVWENSLIKRMTLTSVGIAIAHANIRRVTGTQYDDLSIWIK